jgi:hypothetical protein
VEAWPKINPDDPAQLELYGVFRLGDDEQAGNTQHTKDD